MTPTLDPLEQAFYQAYLSYADRFTARPLYLACSGGRDSLALAFVCLQLYKKGLLPTLPTLLHVNHQLQAQADAWADGVEAFAKLHGFSCQILKVSLINGDENEARTARYQACFGQMDEGGVLLLAHHQNDQAETVLMRLVSGAGLTGLAGMQAWQTRQSQGKTLHLFRGWLGVSRDEISRYADRHALPYVDDPTNETGDNARSVIRRELVPILKTLNPEAIVNIARTAHVIAQEKTVLDTHIGALLVDCTVPSLSFGAHQTVLDIDKLTKNPVPTQYALLRAFIQGDGRYGAAFAFVERVFELCQRTDGDHKTELFWQGDKEGGVVFCRYRGQLYRYSAKLWRAFNEPSKCVVAEAGVLSIALGDYYQPIQGASKLCLVSSQDKIAYKNKHLSGKKLYQTLGIPAWLRPHLYLADFGGEKRLVSVGWGEVGGIGLFYTNRT